MTDLLRTFPLQPTKADRLEIASTALPVDAIVPRAIKRTIDIAVAAIGLVLVAPVLFLVSVLVRLDSSGPVLFRQTRVGVGGRGFRIAKFRTMVVDAERVLADDPELARLHRVNSFKLPVDSDPRVTRIGRFLRRTSLDELPQLWNVLRGDMSIVGARPVEPRQVPTLYGRDQGLYLRMRPGLTGYWQVSGRSHIGDEGRAELDSYYVENWNLWLDVRIMVKTLPAVLSRHGAH